MRFFPLRWPSPAEMRAYARARREEAIKAPQSVGARARALVREQLKDGPKPETSIMAAAEAADIPEHSVIAAASALGVRTRRGQWWIPGKRCVA